MRQCSTPHPTATLLWVGNMSCESVLDIFDQGEYKTNDTLDLFPQATACFSSTMNQLVHLLLLMTIVVLGSAPIHSSSVQRWLVTMSTRPVTSTYLITSLASSKMIARNSKSSSVEVVVYIAGSKNEREKEKIDHPDSWHITYCSLTSFLTPIIYILSVQKFDWWTKVLLLVDFLKRDRLEWPSVVRAKSACFPTWSCIYCSTHEKWSGVCHVSVWYGA